MKSTIAALLFALWMALSVSAFVPQATFVNKQCSTTELSMGLFDFAAPKKKPDPKKKAAPGQKDMNVFAGRGKRITVREDEDNAMWIDEDPKTGSRKSAWPFGGK
ncbi:hypothetical protein ACA910_020152 [Epithemia clementina (nom. ined.)]